MIRIDLKGYGIAIKPLLLDISIINLKSIISPYMAYLQPKEKKMKAIIEIDEKKITMKQAEFLIKTLQDIGFVKRVRIMI